MGWDIVMLGSHWWCYQEGVEGMPCLEEMGHWRWALGV